MARSDARSAMPGFGAIRACTDTAYELSPRVEHCEVSVRRNMGRGYGWGVAETTTGTGNSGAFSRPVVMPRTARPNMKRAARA